MNTVHLSIVLLQAVSLCYGNDVPVPIISKEKCKDNGFTNGLMCSSCNQLSKFNLQQIADLCQQCCSLDERDLSTRVYAAAELEVCTCKFGRYPQIQAFVETKPAPSTIWPNLRIQYSRGSEPWLKMINKDGEVEETLNIQKWDTNTISEYLNTHLEKSY